jgi:hypothetical protein
LFRPRRISKGDASFLHEKANTFGASLYPSWDEGPLGGGSINFVFHRRDEGHFSGFSINFTTHLFSCSIKQGFLGKGLALVCLGS